MPHSTEVLSPQDLLAEVRKFISGAARSSHGSNTLDLARTALSLLQNLPAARDAVLEYFCTVFSVCVSKHVRQIEVSAYTAHLIFQEASHLPSPRFQVFYFIF